MARQDYLPNAEDQLVVWFANLAAKLPGYATLLEIASTDVLAVESDALFVAAVVNYAEAVRLDLKETTAFKNLELYGPLGGAIPTLPGGADPITLSPRAPGIIPRTRALVQRVKAAAHYTQAIGQDLGVVGPEASEPLTVKPTGRAFASGPHEATVEFRKGGFDGVLIECRRAGEAAFALLAFDTYSPYVDNRPPLVPGQPEAREYRMRYRKADEAVGEYSDVMSVVVNG
jgi:hypothetical protein